MFVGATPASVLTLEDTMDRSRLVNAINQSHEREIREVYLWR